MDRQEARALDAHIEQPEPHTYLEGHEGEPTYLNGPDLDEDPSSLTVYDFDDLEAGDVITGSSPDGGLYVTRSRDDS